MTTRFGIRDLPLRPRRLPALTLSTGLCAALLGPASAASLSAASRPAEPPQHAAPAADAASRAPVSRARMLECGHQWNNMKRAGTAAGTWKDFSRVCLAQR